MTTRAQMLLVRGRSHSENLTFQLCCVNKCKTKKERQTTKQKKHRRTSPDVQFKEFSLTKQKLDLERTMNGLGKPFRKKSDPKN